MSEPLTLGTASLEPTPGDVLLDGVADAGDAPPPEPPVDAPPAPSTEAKKDSFFDLSQARSNWKLSAETDFYHFENGVDLGAKFDVLVPIRSLAIGDQKSGVVFNVKTSGNTEVPGYGTSLEGGLRLTVVEGWVGVDHAVAQATDPVTGEPLFDGGNDPILGDPSDTIHVRGAVRVLGDTFTYPKLELTAGLYGPPTGFNTLKLGGQTNFSFAQDHLFLRGAVDYGNERTDATEYWAKAPGATFTNSFDGSAQFDVLPGKGRRNAFEFNGAYGFSGDADEMTPDNTTWSIGAKYMLLSMVGDRAQTMPEVLENGPAFFLAGTFSNERAVYVDGWWIPAYETDGDDATDPYNDGFTGAAYDPQSYQGDIDLEPLQHNDETNVLNLAVGGDVLGVIGVGKKDFLGIPGLAMSASPSVGLSWDFGAQEGAVKPSVGVVISLSGSSPEK